MILMSYAQALDVIIFSYIYNEKKKKKMISFKVSIH